MIKRNKDLSIKEEIEKLPEGQTGVQKSLKKHFGKLKRNLDGLSYQKKIRNEWD